MTTLVFALVAIAVAIRNPLAFSAAFLIVAYIYAFFN